PTPAPGTEYPFGTVPQLRPDFERALAGVEGAMAEFAFHRALAAIWEFVGAVNRFVDTTQPWVVAKQLEPEGRPRLSTVLYSVAESLRLLGIVLQPFVPVAAGKIRVAEVLAAEPVPKSRKLLRLTVSLGSEQRTLVAGIAEHYAPTELVGKKVVVVANLVPAKLMGIESHGMVLAASTEGKLAVLTV